MAVASTFNNHIVLIGLGHLGFRVAKHLYNMGQDVIVIEINPNAEMVTSIHQMDIPVLVDDGKKELTLQAANVNKARAIILCTQDDSLNLQMALKARALNPEIHVVLRIFDDDFALALEKQFGFRALSATGTASPVFAAAASGLDMTRPITVEGEALSLACLKITQNPHIIGKTVSEIEQLFDVSVVLLRRDGGVADFHPDFKKRIHSTDTLAVLGGATEIGALIQDGKK
jgi:Trk K+ transport system NAD-binding subunit